ncbi:hypothetical protein [Myoviridae environmental samples]|nr:hypothetical protein [Myoviridae environmental samples]
MKLVDILARRLLAWPEHAVIVVQDGDKDLKFSEDSSAYVDEPAGVWIRGGSLGFLEDGRIDDLADDHLTAIVTRAQWQEAREELARSKHSNLDNPPVGATHYIGVAVGRSKVDIHSWWMRESGDNWYLWAETARQWALDTPSAGQKNLMKPIRESLQKREWDGKSIPPVGTTCEVFAPYEPHESWAHHIGRQATIIAHDGVMAVYRIDGDDGFIYHALGAGWNGKEYPFRPIRTPEQIAAEEREKHISDICMIFDRDPNSPTNRNHAARLYDAGYRKVNDGNQKA